MVTGLLATLHWIIIMFTSVRVIFRKLPIGTSIGWITIVAIMPFFGFVMYILIGDQRLGRKRKRHSDIVQNFYERSNDNKPIPGSQSNETLPALLAKTSGFIAANTGFHPQNFNAVQLLSTPFDMFRSIIEDIDAARHSCFMEFYIIDPNGRVNDIFEALISAAGRGVTCRILADHVGSKLFSRSVWIARLRDAGIEIIDSLPTGILKSFSTRSDLRNHRKILIIDGRVAYTGSFNLADPEVFNLSSGVGQWVDLLARIEGPTARALNIIWEMDYALDAGNWDRLQQSDSPCTKDHGAGPLNGSDISVQIIPSGPEMKVNVIYETLVAAIYAAQNRVTITTPYLIPDEALHLALINAAHRNVDVRIIVPKSADTFMVRHASRSYYSELLNADVKIFEFDDGLLHTKSVLIDSEVVYFGTVNLDRRSFYLNLEVTVAVYNRAFCQRIAEIHMDYLSKSQRISQVAWQRRPKPRVFLENVMRLASPLL